MMIGDNQRVADYVASRLGLSQVFAQVLPDQKANHVIKLSRATYRKTIENLIWAAGYNIIAIPLAAGVLASRGFVITPAMGAAAMSLSTIICAVNARLLKID